MKLDDMDLLVRVAQTGSMTVAARQSHLTPSAVSAAVRRVEEAMGVRLFERTTRSVKPTDEGLVVLAGCQDMLARWQRTLDEARGDGDALTGVVHLSAPADTTYEVVAPLVVELSLKHPGLQVVVHSSDSLHHLHRDALDMAIRYGPLEDSTLSARKLAECPGILVASPVYLAHHGRPETPEDLQRHRCLTLQLADVPPNSWTLHRGGRSVQVPLVGAMCADGYLARRWAVAGIGIARKNLFDVIDDLESGRLVRVLDDYIFRLTSIHAVFPSRRFPPARVRALDGAVTAVFAERQARCLAWLGRR